MVRSLIADQNLLSTLLGFSEPEAFVPGLILGQTSDQKDYVVHFARSPVLDGTESQPGGDNPAVPVRSPKKIVEIDEKWMSAHARNIIRVLPGGMCVLGLFVVGTGDVFSDRSALNKIRSLVNHIDQSCKSNPLMYGKCPTNCLYVLHLCPLTKNYMCKLFEVENLNASVKQANVKFNAQPVHWFQIDSGFNLSRLRPYFITKEKSKEPLKKKFKEVLSYLCDSLENAVCALDGKFCDSAESLDSIKSKIEEKPKSKDKEKKPAEDNDFKFNAKLYIPQVERCESKNIQVDIIKSVNDLECSGLLSSRVFMCSKATAEEAAKAIKEDIIRSWAARLEMHWNSYDESSEKAKQGKKVFHFLPRRVLCKLPGSVVSFSEYIFPDECITDVISTLEEHLGVKIDPSAIDDTFELQYGSSNTAGSNSKFPDATVQNQSVRRTNSVLMVGIILAAVVLIISVILQLYASGNSG